MLCVRPSILFASIVVAATSLSCRDPQTAGAADPLARRSAGGQGGAVAEFVPQVGHSGSLYGFGVTGDERYLVSHDAETVKVWDAQSGMWDAQSGMWDAQSGMLVRAAPLDSISGLAVNPNDALVAVPIRGADRRLQLQMLDIRTGKVETRVPVAGAVASKVVYFPRWEATGPG